MYVTLASLEKRKGTNFLDFSQIMTNWTTFALNSCSKHKSSKAKKSLNAKNPTLTFQKLATCDRFEIS